MRAGSQRRLKGRLERMRRARHRGKRGDLAEIDLVVLPALPLRVEGTVDQMHEGNQRCHQPDQILQSFRRAGNHQRIETHAEGFGQNLGILNHHDCKGKGKQPDVAVAEKFVEFGARDRRAECMCRRVQDQNHGNGFFNVLLEIPADFPDLRMSLRDQGDFAGGDAQKSGFHNRT